MEGQLGKNGKWGENFTGEHWNDPHWGVCACLSSRECQVTRRGGVWIHSDGASFLRGWDAKLAAFWSQDLCI